MANPDVITISANNYDVYGPLADAEVYFGAKFNSASWDAADTATKNKALVSATRALELQCYIGEPTTPASQPLQWPRTGITDRLGNEVADTDFPVDILNAYYELAQAIIDDADLIFNNANQDDNTKRVKAGDVEAEFFRPAIGTVRFPNQVYEWLKPYLCSGQTVSGGFASGIDGTSHFLDGTYDKTDGFA